MRELPISDCLKEHYKKHGASFTDSERATIFWQSGLPLHEKLAALREILGMTEDNALKGQIRKRLDAEAGEERAFMSRGSGYVHGVFPDDAGMAKGMFASVDAAIAYGRESCEETFRINKSILGDGPAPDADAEQGILLEGWAEFKKDGTLLSCCCRSSKDPGFVIANSIEPEGFEEAYIPVLNPFEYGDIVRVIGDDRPAVVVTSQKDWNGHLERLAQNGMPMNYGTNSLTVEFLYDDGEFSHDHPDILSLEKLEQWEDGAEWNLLTSISGLMKGTGWIGTALAHYRANKLEKG